ncbi:MAG: SUMF1/EgtB/PvdO family nonheme iron enzyme [Caldilineaceae bacterium]|nr:SUMF1/EgtB/PvdO family nonheme iron enzyme [Caldilineaceae bacterium]
MSDNQSLQTILRESLRAYEQARAAHLRSEQAAAAEFTRATAELTAAEQAERARLEAEHRARRATAAGEQARLGDLAAAVTSLEEAARTALAQAGLAHIAGAPAAVDDPPAKARRGDAEVTQLFVQAQTNYVALREAIYRLAQAQVAAGQWDAARQTLKPLLAEKDAPLYEAANEVWCECQYQQGVDELNQEKYEAAYGTFTYLLRNIDLFKDARQLCQQAFQGTLNLVHISGDIDVVGNLVIEKGFQISYAPVSFVQFKAFMTATGYSASPGGAGNGPVNNVSHDDAVQFCAWAGVSLPTDQQWMEAVCPEYRFTTLVDVGSVEYEWIADPHESGGYALRKHNFSTSGVGCSSQIRRNSDIRLSAFGFRVVDPKLSLKIL